MYAPVFAAQRKMTRAPIIAERRRERHPSSQNSEVNRQRRRVPVSGKVCILCECSVGPYIEQNMYVLDVSSEELFDDDVVVDEDGFVPRPPSLRFDFPFFGSHAFCALGSTLFVIEPALDLLNPKNKFVYSFDVSSVNPSRISNCILGKTSLTLRGAMEYAKRFPRATPTPDGKKILIFSTLINYNHHLRGSPLPDHDVADEIDFELYDPLTDSFQALPQIPHNCHSCSINVETCTFVKNSTFLLRTQEIGAFTFDIDDLKSGWKKSGGSFSNDVGRDCVISDDDCVIKDGFLFSPFGACEVTSSSSSEFSPFPLFPNVPDSVSPPDDNIRLSSSCVNLLDVEKNEGHIHLCVVQAGINYNTRLPLMLVDVLSIDGNKYWEEKEKKKKEGKNLEIEAQIVRSFKLYLGDQPCSRISTHIVFSFPGGN